MKKKNIIKTVLIIAGCLFLLNNFFSFTYLKKLHDRPGSIELSKSLKAEIKEETYDGIRDEYRLIDYSINKTAEILQFSKKNNIAEGEANCVGYARLCAAIYNYAIAVNNLDKRCYAKPVVGHVIMAGLDLNIIIPYIVSPEMRGFMNDHDFVEFHYSGENPKKADYADPCIYDYAGVTL